jgi:protein-histidine pros-kinase
MRILDWKALLRRLRPPQNDPGPSAASSAFVHKLTQQALHESEERFRRLIETAPLAIVMVDEQGRISLVNARVITLFGYERAELEGQSIEVLLPERFHNGHKRHREGYFATPSARPMGIGRELAGRRKDGTEFPVEVGLSYIQTGQGILGLAFVTDITERVRLYAEIQAHTETLKQKVAERTKELQDALVLARRADRTKTTMLANVSHEMRTPLSSIIGFSNLVLTRNPPADKQREYMAYIQAEAQRLAGLVDDFLDLQRLETGTMVLRRTHLDLAALLQHVVTKEYLSQNTTHRIHLELAQTPAVWADKDRIQQVVLNLLSNAVKFSPEDGDIGLSLRQDGDEVICSIRDQGMGIPAEELTYLFERFHRGDAAEQKRIRGTGLGLALCKEIIEAHQGRIWAESPGLNQGTVVSFALPIAPTVALSDQQRPTAGQ